MLVRYFAIIKQIKQMNTTHSKFEKQKERSDSGLKKTMFWLLYHFYCN